MLYRNPVKVGTGEGGTQLRSWDAGMEEEELWLESATLFHVVLGGEGGEGGGGESESVGAGGRGWWAGGVGGMRPRVEYNEQLGPMYEFPFPR